jgi:hypothetical protein
VQTYWLVKLAVLVIGGIAALATAMSVAARERQRREAVRARLAAGQPELADNTVVTLRGTVRALGEPLAAPLSGRPCVAHYSIARTKPRAGLMALEGRVHETDSLASSAMVRFVLVTRDGDIIIDADRAEIAQPTRPIIPRKLDREVQFVVDAGFSNQSVEAFAFEEVVIEDGMKIAVCGVARVEITAAAGGEGGFREAPTSVRVVADERHPLTIGPA